MRANENYTHTIYNFFNVIASCTALNIRQIDLNKEIKKFRWMSNYIIYDMISPKYYFYIYVIIYSYISQINWF